MENVLDDLFSPLVCEANYHWCCLTFRHEVLRKYKDCDEFFSEVRANNYPWRKEMYEKIRACYAHRTTQEVNSIFILIFFEELTSILKWKSSPHDRVNVWSMIVAEFLEYVQNGVDYDSVARNVNNAVKSLKDKEKYRRDKIVLVDIADDMNASLKPDITPEFEEFVHILMRIDSCDAWLRSILVELDIAIRSSNDVKKDVHLTDYQKIKARDAIAKKISKDNPELAHLVKERIEHKKRRGCSI